MRTNELVEQLARDARPVRPSTARRRAWTLLSAAALFVAAAMGCVHLRPDPGARILSWPMLTQAVVAAWIVAALVGLARLLQPDGRLTAAERVSTLLVPLGLFVELALRFVVEDEAWAAARQNAVHCVTATLGIGGAAAVGIVAFARRQAAGRQAAAAALIASAATAIGAIVVGFSCVNDNPAHVLGAHLLVPLAALWVAAAASARRLLRY
jgi:hypothetical protein